jgi:hypothetical protein
MTGAAGIGMSAAIAGAINALVAKPARSNFFTVTPPPKLVVLLYLPTTFGQESL